MPNAAIYWNVGIAKGKPLTLLAMIRYDLGFRIMPS